MDESVDGAIRVLRLVTGSMAAGVLVFMGVALFTKDALAIETRGELATVLHAALALVAAGCAAAYPRISRVALRTAASGIASEQQAGDPAEVALTAYRQLSILRSALIEGPAFFAVLVYVLTGSEVALAAAAIGVALLIAILPSRSGLERFLDRARSEGLVL